LWKAPTATSLFLKPTTRAASTPDKMRPAKPRPCAAKAGAPSKALSVTNTGTTDFYIGFANAEGVPITSGELVAASQTREFTAAGLGYATGMSYLNVTGADGTGAKWRVELQ
jgi:hypothetical protein